MNQTIENSENLSVYELKLELMEKLISYVGNLNSLSTYIYKENNNSIDEELLSKINELNINLKNILNKWDNIDNILNSIVDVILNFLKTYTTRQTLKTKELATNIKSKKENILKHKQSYISPEAFLYSGTLTIKGILELNAWNPVAATWSILSAIWIESARNIYKKYLKKYWISLWSEYILILSFSVAASISSLIGNFDKVPYIQNLVPEKSISYIQEKRGAEIKKYWAIPVVIIHQLIYIYFFSFILSTLTKSRDCINLKIEIYKLEKFIDKYCDDKTNKKYKIILWNLQRHISKKWWDLDTNYIIEILNLLDWEMEEYSAKEIKNLIQAQLHNTLNVSNESSEQRSEIRIVLPNQQKSGKELREERKELYEIIKRESIAKAREEEKKRKASSQYEISWAQKVKPNISKNIKSPFASLIFNIDLNRRQMESFLLKIGYKKIANEWKWSHTKFVYFDTKNNNKHIATLSLKFDNFNNSKIKKTLWNLLVLYPEKIFSIYLREFWDAEFKLNYNKIIEKIWN